MVAAMTPAERFAERRKRRQKPWLAKLEPVRPGPVARHPSLTRYPGPKPPPFARRGADGHGRRRVRGIPQPERQSTRHLRGVAPTADARPHATARQAPIPPPVRHHKPCGSRAGTEHNWTKRGGVPASPEPTCPGWCRHGRPAARDRAAPPGRLDPLVPVGRVALRERPGALAPVERAVVPLGSRLAGAEAGRRPLRVARSAADRSRRAVAPGLPGSRPGHRRTGRRGQRRRARLVVAARGHGLPRAAPGQGGRRLSAGARVVLPVLPARRVHPGRAGSGDRRRPRRDRRRGHAAARRAPLRSRPHLSRPHLSRPYRGRGGRGARHPAPPDRDVRGQAGHPHRADRPDDEPAGSGRPGPVRAAAGQQPERGPGRGPAEVEHRAGRDERHKPGHGRPRRADQVRTAPAGPRRGRRGPGGNDAVARPGPARARRRHLAARRGARPALPRRRAPRPRRHGPAVGRPGRAERAGFRGHPRRRAARRRRLLFRRGGPLPDGDPHGRPAARQPPRPVPPRVLVPPGRVYAP